MKFMLACLVAATLLIVAAPYNLLAIGAAVLLIVMGLLEFGAYAVREGRKAHRRQFVLNTHLEDLDEWEAREDAMFEAWCAEQAEINAMEHEAYRQMNGG